MNATIKTALLTLALPLALTACGGGGGGGGGDDTPQNLSRTLLANPALTGNVTASTVTPVGSLSSPQITVGYAGTSSLNGVITFNLPNDIDSDKVIAATLYVDQLPTFGTPYSTYGTMKWQLFDIGNDFDTSDHSGGTLVSPIPAFLSDDTLGPHEILVTGLLKSRMQANDITFSVRMFFPGPGTGGVNNFTYLNRGGGLGFQLRIDYQP